MPTYEFKCQDCFGTLSIFAKFQEEHKPVCPNCSGQMLKVFGPAAVTFKGSGWASKEK